MTYQIVTASNFDGSISKHIIVDNGDDMFISFPADESNSTYVAFIDANPDAVKKVRAA